MKKLLSIAVTTAILGLSQLNAQTIPFPQPSPLSTISQNFATSKIELSYSRPSAKGRKVFGNIVPYGKFWRTGANAATVITFGEDVKINGADVKAGKYGIVSFPGEMEWTLVLTKDLNVNDASAYKQENDVVRLNVKTERTMDFTETFTIDFANMRNDKVDIIFKWENTSVRMNVVSFYDDRLMKQIETVMAKDARPFNSAASYYYENGKDLNQALVWVNKAVESNPKAYWVWLNKAKIQKGLKDYNGAMESSMMSMQLAKEDGDDAYVRNNEALQAEIKALPDYKPAPAKKKK